MGFSPGTTISTTRPTFFWTSVSGAQSYGLYVSEKQGSSWNLIFDSETDWGPISGTSFTIPSGYIRSGEEYRWNMRARNSSGWGSFSSRLYFTVSGGSPPGSFSVSGTAYCNTTPPAAPAVQLTWSSSSGATSYSVYRNGSLYAQGIAGTSFDNNLNVEAGQTYTYFIRAHNDEGSTDSNTIAVSVPSDTCGEDPGTPPNSVFSYRPTAPTVGEAVQFTDESTGDPSSWSWDFGDGTSSGQRNPAHVYASAGSRTVRLRVENAFGSDQTTRTVVVSEPEDEAPTVGFTYAPAAPRAGEPIQFSGSSSQPPTAWSWSFGDGTTAAGRNVTHVYSDAGTYSVRLQVESSSGSGSTTRAITVLPADEGGPTADFVYQPSAPDVGQEVEFTDRSTGAPTAYAWDFGDGSTASGPRVVHAFASAGTFAVQLRVSNSSGSSDRIRHVRVSEPSAGTPEILDVTRELEGVFLEGTAHQNDFRARVRWNGTPGEVGFSINGGPPVMEPGTASGSTHTFRMGRDFPVRRTASRVRIVPTNAEGVSGAAWTEDVYVLPFPRWLEDALSGSYGDVSFVAGSGAVEAQILAEFPQPHLAEDGPIDIPTWVPYLGGRFGLTETFARIDGEVSSLGTGRLDLFGQTGFVAAGGGLSGRVSGGGQFRLFGDSGLELTSASFSLDLEGTLLRSMGIVDAIPALRSLASVPLLNPVVDVLNERVTLTGEVSPRLHMDAVFHQDARGDLGFREASGELGLDLRATLRADVYAVEVQAWVAGGGSLRLGVPEPFIRRADLQLEVGARLTYYVFLLGEDTIVKRRAVGCSWAHGSTVSCDTFGPSSLVSQPPQDLEVKLLDRDYDLYGPYAAFRSELLPKSVSPTVPVKVGKRRLVSNVFPAGRPAIAGSSTARLLLWEHQDQSDPILQSTEIAWSLFDGTRWSEPAWVADDTRAELRPVAAAGPDGKVLAAWLRVKDPQFVEPIHQVSDLPKFNRQLEVVGSAFDTTTRTWSRVTELTEDTSFDTDLQISSDGTTAMLTWLSNPGGQLVSTQRMPSRLLYSEWDAAAGRWSVPLPIAGGLVGVGHHSTAVLGHHSVVLIERSKSDGDRRLDGYEWDGDTWSGPTDFAVAGDNRSPHLAFTPDGTLHVLWIRNGNLVHATWDRPTPNVVRPASGSVGLLDARLLTNDAGNLTLVWREVSDQGPADIFLTIYDPRARRWSADRRLTRGPAEDHAVSGFFDERDDLHLAYLSTEIERVAKTVGSGSARLVIPNVPSDGRTDLEVLDHSFGVDVAVADSDLTSTPARPVSGEPATARLTVHNAGDFELQDVAVELRAEPPGTGPGQLLSQAVVPSLRAGEQRVIQMPFTLPFGDWNLVAVVDPRDGITEASETNNRAVMGLANRPPKAVIRVTPQEGEAPLRVRLDGDDSSDPEGAPLSFRWSFSDESGWDTGRVVHHTFQRAGRFPVTLVVSDGEGGVDTAVREVLVRSPDAPPIPDAGPYLRSPELPGFRLKVRIGGAGTSAIMGRAETACIPETLCVSGAVPGRSEVFVRMVGPKPNGFLWPTLVKFSTSTVEVWAEQLATGAVEYYRLAGASPGRNDLPGLFDRRGFRPRSTRSEGDVGERGSASGAAEGPPPPQGEFFTSPHFPDFRFKVRISSSGGEQTVRKEVACIGETLCVSGAVPGRSELFLRMVGPKPNGYLWPTIVRFTTSTVEVWVEQISSGKVQYYRLEGASPGSSDLSGLFDRTGFRP